MKRLIVGIVSVLLVLASVPCGGGITYNTLNTLGKFNATEVSGAIVTDGTLGPLSSTNWNFTGSAYNGYGTAPVTGGGTSVRLFAEPTELVLLPGGSIDISTIPPEAFNFSWSAD